jgi:hypothetical protein
VEGFVDADQVIVSGRGQVDEAVEIDPLPNRAPLCPVPGMIREYPPHCFGRFGEEMTFAVKVLIPNQPQVHFIDQDRGVERVIGPLARHLRRSELAQYIADQRNSHCRRLAIVDRRRSQ